MGALLDLPSFVRVLLKVLYRIFADAGQGRGFSSNRYQTRDRRSTRPESLGEDSQIDHPGCAIWVGRMDSITLLTVYQVLQ